MSRASTFASRHVAPVGKLHHGVEFGTARRRVPVDPAEIAFVLERRAAIPGISCGQLSRLVFRKFGVERGNQTIRNWLTKAPTTTATT